MDDELFFPVGTRVKRNPVHFDWVLAPRPSRLGFFLRGEVTAIEPKPGGFWHIVKWDGMDHTGWQKPVGYFYDELLEM